MLNKQQQKSILQYQYENLTKCIYQIENEIKNLENIDNIDIEYIASYSIPKEYIELCNSLSIFLPILSSSTTATTTTTNNNEILQSPSLLNPLAIQQQKILMDNNINNDVPQNKLENIQSYNNISTLQQPILQSSTTTTSTSLNKVNDNNNFILSNSNPNNEELQSTNINYHSVSTSTSNYNNRNTTHNINNHNIHENSNLNDTNINLLNSNQITLPNSNNNIIINEDVQINSIVDNNNFKNDQISIINNNENIVSINDSKILKPISIINQDSYITPSISQPIITKDENIKEEENKKKKDKNEKNTSITFDNIVQTDIKTTSDILPVVQSSINEIKTYSKKSKSEINTIISSSLEEEVITTGKGYNI
jgi:hypothetical protein